MKYCIYIVILLFYSCDNQANLNKSKNSIENYLGDKVQSLNIKDIKHGTVNNIIEGNPLEVTFTNADTLLYKVRSNYMIVDSLNNVHFLEDVEANFFDKGTCISCSGNKLFAYKAVLDSKSNTITAFSSISKRARIELEDNVNNNLEADTIKIFNNEIEDLQLIKAIGQVIFNNNNNEFKGSVFVSDFKMENWEFFNPSGEVNDE